MNRNIDTLVPPRSSNYDYQAHLHGKFDDPAVDRTLAENHYQLGKLYYDKADLDQAHEHFDKVLEIAPLPQKVFMVLKTLGFLIRIASEKQENLLADRYIQKAEEITNNLTSVLGSLNAEYFYNVGSIKNYKGEFEEAKANYLICYQKAKEGNEPELLAKCLLALATNCFSNSNYDSALNFLNELSELLQIVDKSYLAGSMHLFYGRTYAALGKYSKALDSFKKAGKYLQSKKCWNRYGYMLRWRGMIYKCQGDFSKALTFFQLALESIDQVTFKRLTKLIKSQIQEVNDYNIDIYLDRTNRKIKEKSLGVIDFKHRFVLLEILFLLAKQPGTYFDKEYLAKNIWKDEYNPLIHDKLIYTSVSRLRKLIEPKQEKKTKRKYIVRGKDGYTFNPQAKIRFLHESDNSVDDMAIGNVDISSPL